MEVIKLRLCRLIWGDDRFGWAFKPSVGRSGGMLCLWKQSIFQSVDVCTGDGFLCIKGKWGSNEIPCAIVNIYSSCVLREKRELWSKLEEMMAHDPTLNWCFAGDFNAVCNRSERKGRGIHASQSERRFFYEFIDNNNLIDLPLLRRKFSCYKPDGSAMSRKDRFLLSEGWHHHWGNLLQWACKRSVSDHCPLILKEGESDWGPKPFRVLDCWFDHPEFSNFVKEKWNSMSISGRACFVLKEKLKSLKADLKEWNKSVFGSLDRSIEATVEELNLLDLEAENRELSLVEEERRKVLTTIMWRQKKIEGESFAPEIEV